MKRIIKICTILVLLAIILLPNMSFASSSPSFNIPNYTINATINTDGSIHIEESFMYYFSSSANGLTRDIIYYNKTDHKDDMEPESPRYQARGISNLSVEISKGNEERKPFREVVAAQAGNNGVYTIDGIYEEGTTLWRLREAHQIEEIDENVSVSQFTQLIHTLKQAEYMHYEISNFCLPNYHSRHNSSYWTGEKYLGCGSSAHSYNGTSRQWNIASIDEYIKGIKNGTNIYEKEYLDIYTRYNDFVLTTIRTCWGMSLEKLKMAFGYQLYEYCMKMAQPHLKQKTLEIYHGALKLTEKGIFISDGIMSDLIWV